ncbi:MAG: hypothetical protein KDE27_01800 [Planctomycetes bacterium]|nr:hypothetical protein [Planctomycetota bacterium]
MSSRFHVSAAVAAFSSLASLTSAQDFIHYKFDSTCNDEVINYATGTSALASNGVMQSTSAISPYVTGVFGSALAAGSTVSPTYSNRVITGWDPGVQNITGDLTMACFMRYNASNGSPFYIWGAPSGGFRMFTSGVAGNGLYQRVILASGGNGVNASIANDFYLPDTTFDFQAAAAAGWVHVAIVVDATAATADWYINGTSVLQLTGVVGGAQITAAGPFQLGGYSSTSHFDVDEFLMSTRAYTPAEILALSLAPQGGDGDYYSGTTTQCGTLALASTGGRPAIGNANYALEVTPSAPSIYAVLFGLDRCTFSGSLPLPFDGGMLTPAAAGCKVLADNLLTLSGVAASGPATLPIPLVGGSLSGVQFYAQAAAVDLTTSAISASNGFTFSIGF